MTTGAARTNTDQRPSYLLRFNDSELKAAAQHAAIDDPDCRDLREWILAAIVEKLQRLPNKGRR